MKEITILYSCDAWHTWDTRRLRGVFTSRRKLKKYLRALKRSKSLSNENLWQLRLYGQTQGLERNYMIETEDINPKYPGR